MPVITTIDDLRELAQRRVPKMFFDYAESGSYTEQTLRDNTSDFDKIRRRHTDGRRRRVHAAGAGTGRPDRDAARRR